MSPLWWSYSYHNFMTIFYLHHSICMHVCTCVYLYVKPVYIVFKLMQNIGNSNLFQPLGVRSTGVCPPPPPLTYIKRRCVFISIYQTHPGNKRFFKASSRHSVIMFENSPFFPGLVLYILKVTSACGCDVRIFTKCHNTKIHADKYKNIFH